MKPSRIILGCILALSGFLAGDAGAQIITEFSAGITADAGLEKITAGPDGNLWFTETSIDRIGRITPQGVVTEFSAGITAAAAPYGITAGPDGNLWFTETNIDRIGRISPQGVVTEFSAGITAGAHPYGITAGPDGNLWFAENLGQIGRITPSGVVTEFSAGGSFNLAAHPLDITAGPDGNLYFTGFSSRYGFCGSGIGRISTLGVVTVFNVIPFPVDITAGPDGNLWFTQRCASLGWVARIDRNGAVTEFRGVITANAGPFGITAGRDGSLWFTENVGNRIGRMTPQGVVTEFSFGITGNARPSGITAGPDGNLWFTESSGNRIGRITGCMNEAACSPPTDLAVAMTHSPDPATAGSPLTYTMKITNAGPAAATGVTLSDTLVAGVTFVSATPSQGNCSGTSSIVCNLGTLNSGGAATANIVITPTQAGAISNTVSVTGNEVDPNLGNNSASEVTTITLRGLPDLTGSWKSAAQICGIRRGLTGCNIRGRLNVVNRGTGTAGASIARLYLSDDATFDASDIPIGQVAIPSLEAGGQALLIVNRTLPRGTSGSGKFVIAVLDASGVVTETDESNNHVATTRLP